MDEEDGVEKWMRMREVSPTFVISDPENLRRLLEDNES
jgi:hypothetical protein